MVIQREGHANTSRSEGLRSLVTRMETSIWAAPGCCKELEAEPEIICEFTAFLTVHTESLVSPHELVGDQEISGREG